MNFMLSLLEKNISNADISNWIYCGMSYSIRNITFVCPNCKIFNEYFNWLLWRIFINKEKSQVVIGWHNLCWLNKSSTATLRKFSVYITKDQEINLTLKTILKHAKLALWYLGKDNMVCVMPQRQVIHGREIQV